MSTDVSPRPLSSALAAAGGYIIWGLFPMYWKLLQGIDAIELIAHRVFWAVLLLLGIVALQGRLASLFSGLRDRRNLGLNALSGALLSVNWLVYVWAVNAGHVIECSLGYFLVPLINVAIGRFILGERLRRAQALAIALAAIGVFVMIWVVGRPPWIALALAGSFGFYGLLRKRSTFGPLLGLTAETMLLAPLALGLLLTRLVQGTGAVGVVDVRTTLIILSTGAVTAVPLLLFAKGARGLRFTTLGLLQYLAPTLQFLLGWALYHEPLSQARIAAFALIWAGLLAYTADALWAQRAVSRIGNH
jgi:chloramphenicol-sensitive protein RarD